MPRVFVSYASEDVDWVEAVVAHAEASNQRSIQFVRASDPDSLRPGVKWRDWILLEMDRADLAVFFISPRSIHKPWLNFELGYVEKSAHTPIICVTLDTTELAEISGPIAGHHLISMNRQHKIAAEQLIRFVGDRVPLNKGSDRKYTIQIGSKILPLGQGWQRYVRAKGVEIREGLFGISFGDTFDDDGFRYPASQDSLQAPWQFLLLKANPQKAVHVYFVMELMDASRIKLYVNSWQDSIGFGSPKDEFQIPVPPTNRPDLLLIDTRSFVARLGQEPRAVKGLRVRGPTELANIGMFEFRASIPPRLHRGAMEIALP